MLYALAGAALFWKVRNVFPGSRTAVRLVLLGFLFAVVAAGIDTVAPESMSESAFNLQQAIEEIIETSAWVCFLLACVVRYVDHLTDFRAEAPGCAPTADSAVAAYSSGRKYDAGATAGSVV